MIFRSAGGLKENTPPLKVLNDSYINSVLPVLPIWKFLKFRLQALFSKKDTQFSKSIKFLMKITALKLWQQSEFKKSQSGNTAFY